MENDEVLSALMKRAIGYTVSESVEEYSGEEDSFRLLKKKITKKDIPPDVSALKVLLEYGGGKEISQMSDSELESEKLRLLKMLKEYENGKDGEEKNPEGE
jgi:hypothetical protein